ncbi:MAG: glycerophosphodiester phosphodiesterase [Acidobacteriota bacterium]|nr:glycerophosphodiester phosphodiesterase [Acidobacteriota bacterium]
MPPPPPPLLLGHRGARAYAAENTFDAFALALEHGCDGFEFDVRLSSDDRALICHDADFARVPVAENTWANLAKLQGGLMPLLEHVMKHYAAKAFLDIELKVPGLDDEVLDALRDYPPQHGYVVSSFLPQVIESLGKREKKLRLGFICDDKRWLGKWRELPVEVVAPHYGLVDEALVRELHAAGKQVYVWTVNRAEAMQQMAELGVDAIISDDTQLLSRTLRPRKS